MSDSYEHLLSILEDESAPIPVSRLSELSDLDQARVDRLLQLWPNLTAPRRRELIEELGQLADMHFALTFEPINQFAIDDPDPVVRCIAIGNLWESEDPSLAPRFINALLKDPHADVRAAAATALGHFVLLGELGNISGEVLTQVEDALLATSASDPQSEVRWRCIESLGYSSRSEVTALIQAAYDSGIEEPMRAALLAMGRSANNLWNPQVLAELNSPSPLLRCEAARAAGELEIKEAVPTLIELLDDVADDVRIAAVWALGQLGGEQASQALSALLQTSPDEDEAAWIQDALDHLIFVDNTQGLLFSFPDESEEDQG